MLWFARIQARKMQSKTIVDGRTASWQGMLAAGSEYALTRDEPLTEIVFVPVYSFLAF